MNVRGHTNSVLWMYAICWLRQATLIQFSQRNFWTNCVHSWYRVGVTAYIHGAELMWPHKVMVRSWCVHSVHCILYSRIHLADFMFLLYIAQSRQSSRLFLQSSELGLLCPLNRRRVCPPLLWFRGGHTRLRVRGHFMELMWPRKVTLRSKKNQHKVTLTSQSDFKSD